MITPQAGIKLQEVSNKYIPLLDKAIQEGRKQLERNALKREWVTLRSGTINKSGFMKCDGGIIPFEKGSQFYGKSNS